MTDRQWYFNTVKEQPELGMLSPSSQRMGPYKSRQDAIDAWKIVKERNLLWEETNRKWSKWDRDGYAGQFAQDADAEGDAAQGDDATGDDSQGDAAAASAHAETGDEDSRHGDEHRTDM
nr:hypothetical protein [Bifidobacterium jacchi]